MTSNTPEDLFRTEKERSLSERGSTHAQLLAEAKAAFDKLMAEGQAARKSGRPRKNPLPPLRAAVPAAPAPRKPAPAPKNKAAHPAAKKATGKKPAKKSGTKPTAHKAAHKKSAPKKSAKGARRH